MSAYLQKLPLTSGLWPIVILLITIKLFIKRPTRDACLCMGDLQAPPAPHFVFLITL